MKRGILLIIGIVAICGLIAVAYFVFNQVKPAEKGSITANQQTGVAQNNDRAQASDESIENTQPPEKRSDTEILDAIIRQDPSLIGNNNQPVFTIARAQKTPNAWYVVTLRHQDPTVTNAKIIMKDNGGDAGLVIIAGPGTYFDPDVIYLPSEVRALL